MRFKSVVITIVILLLAAAAMLSCVAPPDMQGNKQTLLEEFDEREVELTETEITTGPIEGCLDDQLATRYDLDGGGRMYVFEYPDEEAAEKVADPIPPNAFAGPCGAFDYVSDLRYFLWGGVIFVMVEQDADQLAAAREIAGEPFACALGYEEPKEGVPRCELEEG